MRNGTSVVVIFLLLVAVTVVAAAISTQIEEKFSLIESSDSNLKNKIKAEKSTTLKAEAMYNGAGKIKELKLKDIGKKHSKQTVKIHKSVIDDLEGCDGVRVGVTHIADDGTVTNRVVVLEYETGYAVIDMEFSENIISGYTGYTRYSATNVSGNTTVDFGTMLNVSSLSGSISAQSDVTGYALPYWIQGTSSGDNVYVNVPSIPANGVVVLGLDYEEGYSPSGDDVFNFFDDFSSDLSKWTQYDGTGTSISGGWVTADNNGIETIDTFSYPMVMEFHGYAVYVDSFGSLRIGTFDAPGLSCNSYQNTNLKFYYASTSSNEGVFSDAVYSLFGASGDFRLYRNNVLLQSATDSISSSSQRIRIYGRGSDGVADHDAAITVDWILVRQYISTEPTVTVESSGSGYIITIENNLAEDLTDYQIHFPATDIGLSSTTESLYISGNIPADYNVSIGDVSENKTIRSGENETFLLNPTIDSDNFSIVTNGTDYDYNFTLYWTEDVLLVDEVTSGINWTASIFHNNSANITYGNITFTPTKASLDNLELNATNANATYTYSDGTIIIGTGQLSAYTEHFYNFTARDNLHSFDMRAYDSSNSGYLLNFTGFVCTEEKTTENGTIHFTDIVEGTYPVGAYATGYYYNTSQMYIDSNDTITILLRSTATGENEYESGTGQYYEPNTVELIYMAYWGTRYDDVDVSVYEGHRDNVIFSGSPNESATLVTSGTTGDTGGITFELSRYVTYTFYATCSDPAFTKISCFAPKDERYYIFINKTPFSDDNTPSDNIYYGVHGEKVNLSTAQINASFTDISNSTTLAEFWVNDSSGSMLYYMNTTEDSGAWSTYVNVSNETYYTYFRIDTASLTEPKLITKTFTFFHSVHPVFNLGFTEQWQYHIVFAIVLLLVVAMFGVNNVHLGGIVAIAMGWLALYIGYLEASVMTGLVLSVATLIAGGFYMRKQEAY
jgi:hypothetical protein